jgi:hypothetical protein
VTELVDVVLVVFETDLDVEEVVDFTEELEDDELRRLDVVDDVELFVEECELEELWTLEVVVECDEVFVEEEEVFEVLETWLLVVVETWLDVEVDDLVVAMRLCDGSGWLWWFPRLCGVRFSCSFLCQPKWARFVKQWSSAWLTTAFASTARSAKVKTKEKRMVKSYRIS